MTPIERATLEITNDAASTWRQVAVRTLEWAKARDISVRDAVVLLPFAQLLPLARAAFAATSVWLPRIETGLTLAAALGPAAPAVPGQLSFDAVADRLAVAQLLREQPWGAAWARADRRAFDAAVVSVVNTAHAFARSAASQPPEQRAQRWVEWRELLAPFAGPGGRQRALAALALEWASQAAAPNSDRLFALQPSAWIVVQAGGVDALAAALLEHSAEPRLWLDLDPPEARRYELPLSEESSAPATFALCDDFEHEAQCSAAQLLVHVQRGETPVALIAQDRALVRRVRALLERQHVTLHDETGWKLSTTRAAAQLMSLLKAARPGASTDAALDWLKSGTRWSASNDPALARFEAACRKKLLARVDDLNPDVLDEPAHSLWAQAGELLGALHSTRRLSLAAWLQRCGQALVASAALPMLQADDAGRQVLAQLHLDTGAAANPWAQKFAAATMSYAEFVDWVDSVLEQASFVPTVDRAAPVDVIITPLARAMLRPFRAAVFPGADGRRLGAGPQPHVLLPDALLGEMGLPDAAAQRVDETMAFAQALRLPNLTLLRRRRDGDEPLTDSPLLERLRLALARRGERLAAWIDPRPEQMLAATPIGPSAPAAPTLLPNVLSASACEALRACPYRFHTLYALGAREADELDEAVEKRDYGTWLHAVLHAFHSERGALTSEAEDIASLHQHAEIQRVEQGLDAAEFVPFAASFDAFVPRYVAWQRARDAAGAAWSRGEYESTMPLPHAAPFALKGVIDRIDTLPGQRLQLIDYKTGGASGLRDKVRVPLEDTQLAFYAALMRAESAAPLRAIYLALDGREIEEFEHKDVPTSAEAMLAGLADDLLALQSGAGMAPLGEAQTCDYCAARGVCRRDHWSTPPDTVSGA